MTPDPKDAEIARYNLTGYDRGTEVAHEGAWVRHSDHAAEIARLTAELRVYMDAAEAHAVETMRQRDRAEKAEAERDAALAQVARLRAIVEFYENLTGTIGTVVLSRRDAQMRAEGMRKAAEIADAKDPDKPTNYLHRRENIPAAILAAAEKGE